MAKSAKNWPFLLGLILSISLLWPLAWAPLFKQHDDIHIIRVYEMDKCIKDGQIPCRWVPDLGNLYGYPLFNYYAPLPYYFGEFVFLITNSLIFSEKIMFALSFLGSYIFMYLLASKFWGKIGGSLSAIFYSFAPFHALDFYVRGAMGEMWGLMFFPAIIWSFTKLEEETTISNLLLSAIFLAGLILSHNLSAFIFLPFALIWVALLFFKKRIKKFLYFSLSAVLLGILLSSFYLFPMIFEKNLVHVDNTTSGYFYFTEHFKGLKKVVLDRSWGYGPSVREVPGGEKDLLSYQIGWIHLLGWVLALISAKLLWKKNRWLSRIIIFASISILFSIFMIHPRSEVVWKTIEQLKYLQFPWRFLILVIFFISFLSGSIFLYFKDKKLASKLWIALSLLVVVFNFPYFKPEKFLYQTNEQLLKGENWERQIKRSIFDFLPIYAKEPPADLADSRYQILTGDSRVYDFKQGSNWITFKTDTNTHTIIRLSQYYFPNWKIFVDGKEINIDYKNNSLGLMTFILGKGHHEVWAKLYDTQIRSSSNLLSIIAFTLMTILFLLQFKRVRKWILYYRKRID